MFARDLLTPLCPWSESTLRAEAICTSGIWHCVPHFEGRSDAYRRGAPCGSAMGLANRLLSFFRAIRSLLSTLPMITTSEDDLHFLGSMLDKLKSCGSCDLLGQCLRLHHNHSELPSHPLAHLRRLRGQRLLPGQARRELRGRMPGDSRAAVQAVRGRTGFICENCDC